MPEIRIGGSVLSEREFQKNLSKFIQGTPTGRRLSVGTLVGSVRSKSLPENAIAGQPTQVTFVVSVKLNQYPGKPVIEDALITNQARQLVSGSSASGTPVTVEISKSGVVTVIGRAAYGQGSSTISYHTISDLKGVNMAFALGMRITTVSASGVNLTGLNAWRTANGKTTLVETDLVYVDPQISFHGVNHYQGYIALAEGGRFTSPTLGLVCGNQTVYRDFYDHNALSLTGCVGVFMTGEIINFDNGAQAVIRSRREDLTGALQIVLLSSVLGEITGNATGLSSGATGTVDTYTGELGNSPDWWNTTAPVGFGETDDPWYVSYNEQVCS